MTTTIPAGWLPIESAPKDGTPVLLFARLAGVNFATNSPYAPTIHVGAYRTDLCIWTGSAYRDQREIEIEPTHWMPRPAFPDCAAPGASTAGNPQPARDWELTCHECDGSGHVYVKHQVAERKTDMQEFKEECECCEGRGFVFAFQDIPGIEEYVKACRTASSAPGVSTVEDERQAFEAWFARRGVWPALCFEEVFIAGWNARPVDAPAAGDALDAARWRFVRRKLCLTGNGDGTCAMQAINLPASIPGWPEPGSAVAEFCDAAIDAAIAAQRKGGA